MANRNLLKKMVDAFVGDINKSISRRINNVRTAIRPIIFNAVHNAPAMSSIRGGGLKYDFGLSFDPTHEIAEAVSNAVSLNFRPFKFVGGFVLGNGSINIQPSDYFELLSMPSSVVITEKNESLPWLDWLLNYGDNIIIADFGVKYSSGKGRSGGAIMIQNGRPFRVNPEYSGTNDDNFIVRALNANYKAIEQKIWRTILN